MPTFTRRSAVFLGLSLASLPAFAKIQQPSDSPVRFNHGIASGDPTARQVILWTRISTDQTGPLSVRWEMSQSADFAKIKRKGHFVTDASRDFTVKIDAKRLKSGTDYYYRFKVGGVISPIGHTKTLPKGHIDQARFAVVSCSNLPFGYFNVYDHIAANPEFDAVIHLGDYFYEYGHQGYGGRTGARLGRQHNPAHETLSLADYRTRHAQYKADSASQALHAAHPLICVWDDHETANDSWKAGAQNHGPDEGSWDDRRTAALKAYYEWMPVRDPKRGAAREALFRKYSYGNLLTIAAIETRLTARTQPLRYSDHAQNLRTRDGIGKFVKDILWDEQRELLGPAQKSYIAATLKSSKRKQQAWRLIANQTIMARVASPDISDYKDADFVTEIAKIFPAIRGLIALSPLGLPRNLDAWDGYPAARERFYTMAQENGVNDLLVLTGDTHESWANVLTTKAGVNMGIELGTPAVTSPGAGAYFADEGPELSRRLKAKNQDILYHDLSHKGYLDLQLTPQAGRVDFVGVSTVLKPEYEAQIRKSFKLVKTDTTINLQEL